MRGLGRKRGSCRKTFGMPSLVINFQVCNIKRSSVFSLENCNWLLLRYFAPPDQAPSHGLCLLLSGPLRCRRDEMQSKPSVSSVCYQKKKNRAGLMPAVGEGLLFFLGLSISVFLIINCEHFTESCWRTSMMERELVCGWERGSAWCHCAIRMDFGC